MKKSILVVLCALAFCIRVFAGPATVAGQVVHIDVDTRDKIVVDGKPVPLSTLSATLGSVVHDTENAAVELKIPANLDAATTEQIKNACRKAGLSRFSVVTKPATKG